MLKNPLMGFTQKKRQSPYKALLNWLLGTTLMSVSCSSHSSHFSHPGFSLLLRLARHSVIVLLSSTDCAFFRYPHVYGFSSFTSLLMLPLHLVLFQSLYCFSTALTSF